MILAYHVIITAYGFWLPNDPRGSWSDFVRAWELFRFGGAATKTDTRRSVAGAAHDHQRRLRTKEALARPPVSFNGIQARAIGRGFTRRAQRSGYEIYACSILPEHVHLVIGRHRYSVEKVTELLKGAASERLADEGLHPFQDVFYRNGRRPTPWARKLWKVFLFNHADILRSLRYVEENPLKEGKPRQSWPFVVPYVC